MKWSDSSVTTENVKKRPEIVTTFVIIYFYGNNVLYTDYQNTPISFVSLPQNGSELKNSIPFKDNGHLSLCYNVPKMYHLYRRTIHVFKK